MPDQSLLAIAESLRQFAAERDWEQFHTPRNLATALNVEAAELLEHFQWLNDEQVQQITKEKHEQISLELADVFLYLIRLADRLDIDLIKAANRKIRINSEKYPVERVRGSARKYTEY